MEHEQDLQKLKSLISSLERELLHAKTVLKELEFSAPKVSYKDVPGVEGTFDGVCMVTATGEKHEVPANYAAKTKLVFGDRLKMLEENGKTVFKNIDKQPRKKLEGVLNRKEGKWYALTEKGTYRVSDSCVEFNEFKVNDKVMVLVPENNLNAPFAAIESEKHYENPTPAHVVAPLPPKKPQPAPPRRPAPMPPRPIRSPRPTANPPRPQPPRPMEFVSNITSATPAVVQDQVTRILDDEDLR